MAWTETEHGVYTQPFDAAEAMFYKTSKFMARDGKEHAGLHCICTVRLDESVITTDATTTLREAWKALRFDFPGLGVEPEGLTTKKYQVPDAAALDNWADRTFFVENERTVDGLLAGVKISDLPSLYYLPSTSQILFLASHWRVDATGTCLLLDRYFSILTDPKDPASFAWGTEVSKISPTMEDAADCANDGSDPEVDACAREYIKQFHSTSLQKCGLPYKGDRKTVPGSPVRVLIALTEDSTKALLIACKSRQISVTAAIHAALAETVLALAPSDQDYDYQGHMAVSVRSYLPPPYNEKSHACQTYATGIMPKVDRNGDFHSRTTALTQDYKDWHNETFIKALRLIYKYHAAAVFKPKPPPTAAAQAAPAVPVTNGETNGAAAAAAATTNGAPKDMTNGLALNPAHAAAPPATTNGNKPNGAPPSEPALPNGVSLSSLGLIEPLLSPTYSSNNKPVVSISDFRFGVNMMTRQSVLYLWTFMGRLNLSMNYNGAYRDEDKAMGVLESIREICGREMGIQLQAV